MSKKFAEIREWLLAKPEHKALFVFTFVVSLTILFRLLTATQYFLGNPTKEIFIILIISLFGALFAFFSKEESG